MTKSQKIMSNKDGNILEEEIRRLVIERIKATSDDLQVAIGGEGELSKKELIESVESGDEKGKEIINIQMEFLRDMASGKIYQNE